MTDLMPAAEAACRYCGKPIWMTRPPKPEWCDADGFIRCKKLPAGHPPELCAHEPATTDPFPDAPGNAAAPTHHEGADQAEPSVLAAVPTTDGSAPTVPARALALVAEQAAAAAGRPAPGNPHPGAVRTLAAATGETGAAAGVRQPQQWTVREPGPWPREHVFESGLGATAAAGDYATLFPGQPIVLTYPSGVRVAMTAVILGSSVPDGDITDAVAHCLRLAARRLVEERP